MKKQRLVDIKHKSFIKRKYYKNIIYFVALFLIFIILTIYINHDSSNETNTLYYQTFLSFIFFITNLFFFFKFIKLNNIKDEYNALLSSSLNSMTDFLIICDAKGNIVFIDNKSIDYINNKFNKTITKTSNISEIFDDTETKIIIYDLINKKSKFDFFIYKEQKIGINYLDIMQNIFCIYNQYNSVNRFDLFNINILKKIKLYRICTDENGNIIHKLNANFDTKEKNINKILKLKDNKRGFLYKNPNQPINVLYYNYNFFYNRQELQCHLLQCKDTYMIDETYHAPMIIFSTDFEGNILKTNNMFNNKFDSNIKNIQDILDYNIHENIKTNLTNLPNPLSTCLVNGKHVKIFNLIFNDIVVFYLIDNSELIHTQNQLSHSQKVSSIGQLAGGIAHDFNNILTGILGFCDLLIENNNNKHNIGEIIEIKNSASKGKELVAQIMSFARKQTIKPKIHNINTVLSNTSKFLSQIIGENIKLDIKYDKKLGFVKIDSIHLQQIIVNIIINAKDALENIPNAIIKIKTYNKSITKNELNDDMYSNIPIGEYIVLSISDNGSGIKSEYINKIFDPFFTTKNNSKGTGLGLSTVYGLINQMNGYIKVSTNNIENSYTTFYIYFPKSYSLSPIDMEYITSQNNEQNSIIIDKTKDDINKNKFNIMIVEDEHSVKLLLEKFLIKNNYNVISMNSSLEAVEYFKNSKNKKIDLIISDVIMPELNGPEMIKKIYQINNNIKILFISGYSDDLLKDKQIPVKFEHVTKPFVIKALLQKIQKITELQKNIIQL